MATGSLTKTENELDARRLFEDCAWLYAFCREHLFRDHTEEIAQALFPEGVSSQEVSVLEVGCGPGFYSRRLAQRFPALRALGIDRSSRLVSWAQGRASADCLTNCLFLEGDVEALSSHVEKVDAVISSRLLLVVADRSVVLEEIFRVLKPGGRLFLAEPTANFKTQLPLSAMRFVDHFMQTSSRQLIGPIAEVLSPLDFEQLVRSQPWNSVSIQMYGDYQCAVCEKSSDTAVDDQSPEANQSGLFVTTTGSRY